MNVDRVVRATVRIEFGGEPVGSGFRFLNGDLVITSAHVFPAINEEVPITATCESGTEIELDLVDVSPEPRAGGHDYAILRAEEDFPEDLDVLEPHPHDPERGDEVGFAGHPFYISDTLFHTATVSGPHGQGFYLDGSINSGNSGGPIVDNETGDVVGIITESKIHRSRSLEEIIEDLNGVQQQISRIQEVHDTTINRVEVEELAMGSIQQIQDAIDILSENISSGVGVGYSIDHVLDGVAAHDVR